MTSHARTDESPVDPSSRPEVSQDVDDHWQIIKAGFVDDPLTAVVQAGQFVAAMVEDWIERIHAECASLQANRSAASTEQLRIQFQRYDDFIQRMSGKRMLH